MTLRIGSGFDAHAFTPERPLVLAGVTIPSEMGLAGHSDADVVIHAVVDALLGAAALGDIGMHFPSHDPRWKDQPSALFLSYACDLLHQHGWRVVNVDATVIAQRPRLAPYVMAMRARLAELLELPLAQVSVKATTTDGLGFTGRGEGIACSAVALLEEAQSATVSTLER